MSKHRLKKDANELQEYLQFRRRGSRVDAEKGKGSKYKRSREKSKARKELEWEVCMNIPNNCKECPHTNICRGPHYGGSYCVYRSDIAQKALKEK